MQRVEEVKGNRGGGEKRSGGLMHHLIRPGDVRRRTCFFSSVGEKIWGEAEVATGESLGFHQPPPKQKNLFFFGI